MRHTNHEDVWVRVYTPDQKELLAEINFAQFINKYSDMIDVTKNEVLIPFQIIFKPTEVTITLPSWFVETVRPIL